MVGRNFGDFSKIFLYLFLQTLECGKNKIQGQVDSLKGLPEVFISFPVDLSHSVPRPSTSCRGLILRVKEYVSPAEAVPIHRLVTG